MSNCYRNLMRFFVLTTAISALTLGLASFSADGAPLKAAAETVPVRPTMPTIKSDSSPVFPTLYGVQQTGKVNSAFDAFGCFGLGYARFTPDITAWPTSSFETPAGGGVDYLFGGAIWVGGIVSGDTLVALGADGWQLNGDIYPTQYTASNKIGTVNEVEPVGDYAFRAEYSDTAHQGIFYPRDVITQQPMRPLNVNIATRSEIWHGDPRNNCILYDVVITNVGQQTIHNGYIGLFMDGDVGEITDQNRATDDVAGSIRDSGIAYIIDNDGNFNQAKPALGAFACRFLWNSWGATDTSFNWWVSNGATPMDFGPRLRANYRDFGTGGGLGTPEGSANKYYLLSHPEWDYDQVMTGTTGVSDSTWMNLSSYLAQSIAKGWDTRFLLSLGQFELPPDSSIRFIFATYAADSIHTSAANGQYLIDWSQYDPNRFLAGLNFSNLYRNAGVADSLAGLLRNPADPVQGLRIASNSHDTVVVTWDDWCLSNIDGYNIYLDSLATPYAQIGREHRFVFTGLDPSLTYSATVAHRIGSSTGNLGRPLVFQVSAEQPTDVNDRNQTLPGKLSLAQNYPNPFNPSTTIEYNLPNRTPVLIQIYNVLGQPVRKLVNRTEPAGKYSVSWDGTDDAHHTVPSGIYFYRLQASELVITKKMVLLK